MGSTVRTNDTLQITASQGFLENLTFNTINYLCTRRSLRTEPSLFGAKKRLAFNSRP